MGRWKGKQHIFTVSYKNKCYGYYTLLIISIMGWDWNTELFFDDKFNNGYKIIKSNK